MWNNIVPGFDEKFYFVAYWFLAYAVMGWVVETCYISFCNKKFTNRGYIHGPICPIYGVGGLLVHLILSPFAGNYLAIFVVGSIFATSIEYTTAQIMIKAFGCVWWDYTNKPFNYKGILCLESSVVWGLYSVMDVTFLKDVIFIAISRIPYTFGKIFITGVVIYYTFDFVYSTLCNKNGEIEDEENNIKHFEAD